MKKKTYNLSIFLLKEDIKKEENAIQGASSLTKSVLNIKNKEYYLYSKQLNSHEPNWLSLFSTYTKDIGHLKSSGCGAVLLVKSKNRFFALTFGYGRYILEPDCIEDNFGLKVVVNAVDSTKLRCVDAHTLESMPVHKKNQASISTHFSDFGLDIEQDLMYAAAGSPKDKTFCKTLSGKDALKISLPFDLNDLPSLLDKVIDLFNAESYKQDFPWIDRLTEIKSHTLKNELDSELVNKVIKKDFSKTWISIPEVIDWENVAGFRYQKPKKGELVDNITWEEYLNYASTNNKGISIERLKGECIYCIGIDNDLPIYKWNVYQCIYCEIEFKNELYSLTNGKWYKINADFLKKLNEYMDKIPITTTIAFPSYSEKSEEEYNKKVVSSDSSRFLLMDKKNISYGNGNSRIELCDIYTKDKKLIHVKKYGGSSVLSHLFSQGLVSTQLILSDGDFRTIVNKKLPTTHKLPKKNERPKANEFEVVYAIACKDKTEITSLPLFSKINLRSCHKKLLLMGVTVSICIVPITDN